MRKLPIALLGALAIAVPSAAEAAPNHSCFGGYGVGFTVVGTARADVLVGFVAWRVFLRIEGKLARRGELCTVWVQKSPRAGAAGGSLAALPSRSSPGQ